MAGSALLVAAASRVGEEVAAVAADVVVVGVELVVEVEEVHTTASALAQAGAGMEDNSVYSHSLADCIQLVEGLVAAESADLVHGRLTFLPPGEDSLNARVGIQG